jgi:hypothetical protein
VSAYDPCQQAGPPCRIQMGRVLSGFEFGATCKTVTAEGAAAGLVTGATGERAINRASARAAAAIRTMAAAAADPRVG